MSDIEINDVRSEKDFKSITFSGYQKTRVKKELIVSMSAGKIENTCYWGAEMICAGHFAELWEIIVLYVSKHIHLGSPRLPTYISMRMDNFKEILVNGYVGNEIRLRNNPKIRDLFAEILATLCMSRKKHVFEAVKIKKSDEFNMAHMSTKLKAPKTSYADGVFTDEDPKELFIAVNELAYHLSSESQNSFSACYWLEWIIEFEQICKKSKDVIVAKRRCWAPVNPKYHVDPIWIVWELITDRCSRKGCAITTRIIESLLGMFSLRYGPSVKKRRRFLVYFAISLLTEPVDLSINIWSDKAHVSSVVKKIACVYKQVKKNEQAPATDYLFAGTEKTNLDKTIARLEMMNAAMKAGST